MWLTRFALKQPTIITLFFAAVVAFGIVGFFMMGQNVNPNVQFPGVEVDAAYPGASPEEMERLVVRPIEDQLQNVRHVDQIFSRSTEGGATISVQFKLGTDVNAGANDVQQAVDQARAFQPPDLNPPQLQRADTGSQSIMTYAITSASMSPVALSDLVQQEVIPALRGIKGVGTISTGGDFTREIHVNPDPTRLMGAGATLLDVSNALAAGNVSLPGGRLDQGATEATVGVRADITDPADFAQLPVSVPGAPPDSLKVGDLATISDTHADQLVISTLNGKPAIVLNVSHDSDGDTASTTKLVRAKLADLATQNPHVHFQEIQADEDFLKEAVAGVGQNLAEGIFLTALVLLLFLHMWRSAAVVMIAIPTSILATFFVMWMLGFSIDLLSLMGLSLTIGILVDDSIVVIENITRHREMGKRADEAALVGRTEIGGAAVAITLVDVVVFAPIAFMGGIVGEFLREYALVIVTATMFSLLVSFTLTPLLAAKWAVLRKPKESRLAFVRAFTNWFDGIRKAYHDRALPLALRHPWIVMSTSLVLVLGALVLIGSGVIPFEFQPNTEYGTAIANLQYPIGTSLRATQAGTDRVAAVFMKDPRVKDVVETIGGDGTYTSSIQIDLLTKYRHDEHKIVDQLNTMSWMVPGALLTSGGAQNGGGAAITYTLSGPADALDAASAKLADFIKRLPNATGVNATSLMTGPRLEVRVDRARATALDVSPADAAGTARAAVGGVIATKVRSDQGLIDTVVQFAPDVRNNVHNLETTPVRALNGQLVPLGDVATFNWIREPPVLRRIDRERIVRVFANTLHNAPIGPIDSKVQAALKSPGFLPAGVHVASEGDVQFLQDTMTKIGIALTTSFVLIYMLLVILYRNYLTPVVIMASIPVAIVGAAGILVVANALHAVFPDAAAFEGQTLNIFSMLGIVMLMGLVAKNGILLVDYANTLHEQRGLTLNEAIVESASIRFRPIVMTTASMIVGMLPLALGITEGAQFRQSMAMVIIGGLASSLFMTLFLVPAVYIKLVGFVERRRARAAERRLELLELDPELAEAL
ncbi:MAG TPA: efflux RND transporter permease subunit [Candidatus Eremiobacteraceae bacterium]|nr:efflux RND transporter permease subunit [Candidatus Eremiobacteraceae bacterium]